MARIDDYKNAKNIAVETLSTNSFNDIVKRSGFSILEDSILSVPFLNREFTLSFPDFIFKDISDTEKEIPIQEQVLILHYLMAEGTDTPTGNWVSYREIPGASFYFSAFTNRAIDPLKKVFGDNISDLTKASQSLNGCPVDIGDAGFEFHMFPRVPLRMILWQGDDEFPSEANILFDEIIGKILSPEDIAWMAGMLVYRLISISKM
jgi:hypothetical protein